MKALMTVLQRTFTKEFYSQNAMFFFLIIGLAFGFMSGREHQALATLIVSTPFLMLIPGVIWIFYSLKINDFNILVLQAKDTAFIRELSLLPVLIQAVSAFVVVLGQFIPALAYGLFLMTTAFRLHQTKSVLILGSFLCLLPALLVLQFYRKVNSTQREQTISRLKSWFDLVFQRSYAQFFPEHIVRRQPSLVFVIKVFGCLLILAVSQLYLFDDYDHRLLAMATLIAFSTNLIFVFHYTVFENKTLSILRNLPITFSVRLFGFFAVMFIICSPEAILLTRTFPKYLPGEKLLEIIVFSFSLLGLGYSFLLRKSMDIELYSRYILISTLLLIVVILFKVSLIVLALLAGVLTIYWHRKHFYRFEFTGTTSKKGD